MLINMIDKVKTNVQFSSKEAPVYAIGDVHGCGDEFEELLNYIVLIEPNAKIIQLGDLIDRGPHLLKVFQLCRDFNVELVIGNHELNFWKEVCGELQCRSKTRLQTHEKFAQLKSKHQDFIIETISASKNYVKVYNPDKTLYLLTHAPMQKSRFEHNGPALNFCTTSYKDHQDLRDKIPYNVHGHTHWLYEPIEEQLKQQNLIRSCYNINLDSGAVYGKHLTALNLTDLSFIQVQSKETYFKELN